MTHCGGVTYIRLVLSDVSKSRVAASDLPLASPGSLILILLRLLQGETVDSHNEQLLVHQRLGTSGAAVGLSGFGIYSCKSLPQYNGECVMPFSRGRDRRGGVLSTGRDRNSGNQNEGSMRPLEPGACGWQFDVVQPVGEASGQSINLIQQD